MLARWMGHKMHRVVVWGNTRHAEMEKVCEGGKGESSWYVMSNHAYELELKSMWAGVLEELLFVCICHSWKWKVEPKQMWRDVWDGIGIWYVDTSNFAEGVQDLYIRVDAIDLAEYQKSRGCLAKKGMLSILVVPNAHCFDTLVHFLWMLVFKEEEKM